MSDEQNSANNGGIVFLIIIVIVAIVARATAPAPEIVYVVRDPTWFEIFKVGAIFTSVLYAIGGVIYLVRRSQDEQRQREADDQIENVMRSAQRAQRGR